MDFNVHECWLQAGLSFLAGDVSINLKNQNPAMSCQHLGPAVTADAKAAEVSSEAAWPEVTAAESSCFGEAQVPVDDKINGPIEESGYARCIRASIIKNETRINIPCLASSGHDRPEPG
jgi:hypothetical protein